MIRLCGEIYSFTHKESLAPEKQSSASDFRHLPKSSLP